MKAEDLRIGNLVHLKGFLEEFCYRVSSISNEHLNVSRKSNECHMFNYSDFEGIPLTEEIILKCGFEFEKIVGWYIKDGIEIFFNKKGRYFKGNYPIKIHIRYVHQLQNIFYALTGQELEVKI